MAAPVGDISQEALVEGNLNFMMTRGTAITLRRDKVGMQSLVDHAMSYQNFHGALKSASTRPRVQRSATCIELGVFNQQVSLVGWYCLKTPKV